MSRSRQVEILATIEAAEGGGITVAQIAETVGTHPTLVARWVASLVREGRISRTVSPEKTGCKPAYLYSAAFSHPGSETGPRRAADRAYDVLVSADDGYTHGEMGVALGVARVTAASYVRELVTRGLAVDSGRRRRSRLGARGEPATVWVAVSADLARARDEIVHEGWRGGPAWVSPAACPRTHGDPSPCPWARCKHNLLLEATIVAARKGDPWPELDEIPHTCAIDAADETERTLEEVGALMGGMSRERIRQLETRAISAYRGRITLSDEAIDDLLQAIRDREDLAAERERETPWGAG